MTEGDAGLDRGQKTKLLAGTISCLVALVLGAVQVFAALNSAEANGTAGILGIALCILGSYLDARKLATATIFLCVASVIFALAASQGLVAS